MKSAKHSTLPGSINELITSEWAEKAKSVKTQEAIIRQIPHLLKKLGKTSPVAVKAQEAFALFMQARAKGQDIMTARNVIILGAALLYFLCPLDFIPDALPVIGWLDDIGLLALAITYISSAVQKGEESDTPEEVAEILNRARQAEAIVPQAATLGLESEWESILETTITDTGMQTEEQIIEQWQSISADPLRRLVFAGGFSTGKSSLINSLLKRRVARTSPLPCTPVLTTIMKGEPGKERAVIEFRDGGVEIWDNLDNVLTMSEEMGKRAKELSLYIDNDMLENGISFVDTCGLESTEHEIIPFEQLPRSAAFLFVKGANVGGMSKDEYKFFKKVSEHITGDQIIVVLSKADLVPNEAVSRLKQTMRKHFAELGLTGVKLFATATTGENTYELEALRQELIQRAAVSIPQKEQQMAEMAQNAQKMLQIKQQELAHLEEHERAKKMEQMEEECKRRLDRLADKAESIKISFRQLLDDYSNNTLWPAIATKVDNSKLDEHLAADIRVQCRNSICAFVKAKCSEAVEQLQVACGIEELGGIIQASGTFHAEAPTNDSELIKKTSEYILPGISIAAFFLMGPLSWLGSIAVPTYIMDKMGVGKALGNILASFGPGRKAREEFKKALKTELQQSVNAISAEMDTMLDKIINSEREAVRRNLNY